MSIKHRVAFDQSDGEVAAMVQYANANDLCIGDARRYAERATPALHFGSSVTEVVHCLVGKRAIIARDISGVSETMENINREARERQRISALFGFVVTGYNDVPKALAEISEVRSWFSALGTRHPHAVFLLHPIDVMQYVAMFTPVIRRGDMFNPDDSASSEFLRAAFDKGNRWCLSISTPAENAQAMISEATKRVGSAIKSPNG